MRLANLVILSTATLSNEADVTGIDALSFYGPAALTGVVTVQVSPDGGVTWYDSGASVVVNAISTLSPVHAYRVRLSSTLAETADRTVPVHGSVRNIDA